MGARNKCPFSIVHLKCLPFGILWRFIPGTIFCFLCATYGNAHYSFFNWSITILGVPRQQSLFHTFNNAAEIKTFRKRLIVWYNKCKRDLPWRKLVRNNVWDRGHSVKCSCKRDSSLAFSFLKSCLRSGAGCKWSWCWPKGICWWDKRTPKHSLWEAKGENSWKNYRIAKRYTADQKETRQLRRFKRRKLLLRP